MQSTIRSVSMALFGLALVSVLGAAEAKPGASVRTPVEHVAKRLAHPPAALATAEYQPSDRERPFFAKLGPDEQTTGGIGTDYDIHARNGKYVGWFGIVREISEDQAANRTTLLVEHKYFDGLTDAHIQALSFNGSGDFRAVLRGVAHAIGHLTLVKVYGKTAMGGGGNLPSVEADFVRNWHWGAFTFLAALGQQRGSEKWRRLNKIALDDIYNPDPDAEYYQQRLGRRPEHDEIRAPDPDAESFQQRPGKRPDDDALYRRLLAPAGKLDPQTRRRMIALVDSLQTDDLRYLGAAVQAIERHLERRAALAVLRAAVNDEHDTFTSVAQAISLLGSHEEVSWLAALLGDASPKRRLLAAEALNRMEKGAGAAVPALVKALGDPVSDVRAKAAEALSAVGASPELAAAPLKRALTDGDGGVRLAAADALWEIALDAGSTVPVFARALADADGDLCRRAAEALKRIGPDAKAAGPALVEAIKDQRVRWNAIVALASIRPDPKIAVGVLTAALKDENEYVRAEAANALGACGRGAEPAAAALLAALKDRSDYVRGASTVALGKIGPAAARTVPAVVDVLHHDAEPWPRMEAAEAIALIDTGGRAATGALIEALRDPDADVRGKVAAALGTLGPKAQAALPALRAAMKDKAVSARIAAAESLWKISGDAKAAVPVILEGLGKGGDAQSAIEAAGTLGPAAADAVPALLVLLKGHDVVAQWNAAEALGKIGPRAAEAVPALVESLRAEHPDVARESAEALWKIRRDARAIAALIDMLALDEYGADDAAEALGCIGSAARAAIPALQKRVKDPDPRVRKAMSEAMRRTTSAPPPAPAAASGSP